MRPRLGHFMALGLSALLTASCALPVGTPPHGVSAREGSASLIISTPYGSQGRGALAPIQTTVEPANLAKAFASFEVTLRSPSQGTVTKTVQAAEIGAIRFDNLPEANDWTVEILAYDGAKVALGRFSWKQGGIATVKDKTTEWGQAVISALPGKGESPFRLTITDMPSGISSGATWFEVEALASDGTATPLDSASVSKVKSSWSGSTLTLETVNASGHLSPGTYRLTLSFVTASGVAASVAPVFILNLYPTLTSTANLSAALWSDPDPAPSLTLLPPQATSSGLVLSWTPSAPTAVGYEYVWYPGSASPPSAAALDPDNLPAQARQGFLVAGSNSKRLRPSWILEAGTPYDTDRAEVSWTFYVRSLSFDGSWGAWSTQSIDLSSLEFPLLIQSVTFAGGDLWGPSRVIKTAQPDQEDGTFAAEPELSSAGADLDPLSPSATISFSPRWSVQGSEALTVLSSSLSLPISFAAIDRSIPGKVHDLFLYEGEDAGSNVFLSARETELPSPAGRVGRFQRNGLEAGVALIPSGVFTVPAELPGATVSVQAGAFGWNKLRQRDIPTTDPFDVTLDLPTSVNTLFANDHYWTRPVYTFFDGSAIAGRWIPMAQVEATLMPDQDLVDKVGRYSHLVPAKEGGWLATGYAGQGMDRVFLTRLGSGGNTNLNFGEDAPGISYQNPLGGTGVYFGRSIGLVQNQNTGAIVVPTYFQNGVGNVLMRGYTTNGGENLTFGAPNGFLVLPGPYRVPMGQPVADAASSSFSFIEWEQYGAPFQWGITQVAFDGSSSSKILLTAGELDALARFPNGNWIAVGAAGKVVATDTSRVKLPGFPSGGEFTVTLGGAVPNWTAVTVDANGRAVLVGTLGTDGFIARLTALGALDTSFNGVGYVTLPNRYPYAVATMADRKIVVVGDTTATESSGSAGFLRRYAEDGTGGDIDEILPTRLPSSTFPASPVWGTGARSVAVAPDGSIAVAGFTKLIATPISSTLPTLWRFVQ